MTASSHKPEDYSKAHRLRRQRLRDVFLIPTVSMYLILFVPIIVALLIALILRLR
jgi:hypothetical protein